MLTFQAESQNLDTDKGEALCKTLCLDSQVAAQVSGTYLRDGSSWPDECTVFQGTNQRLV